MGEVENSERIDSIGIVASLSLSVGGSERWPGRSEGEEYRVHICRVVRELSRHRHLSASVLYG